MSELTEILVTLMTSLGCQQIKVSTKKHIRRKLETEFGDSLHIIHDSKGKLIVYPDNLSRDQLACDVVTLKTQLQADKHTNTEPLSVVTKAALQIRSDIKLQDVKDEWPQQPSELTPDSANLPDSVIHLLHTVITGKPQTANTSALAYRQTNSIGQDIIYAVTCGKRRLPKHILIPAVVKSLTGNVELIQILNRLGHCVSFSLTEQIETALCLQKLGSVPDNSVILPTIYILISLLHLCGITLTDLKKP